MSVTVYPNIDEYHQREDYQNGTLQGGEKVAFTIQTFLSGVPDTNQDEAIEFIKEVLSWVSRKVAVASMTGKFGGIPKIDFEVFIGPAEGTEE